jgi:hypothetical protein
VATRRVLNSVLRGFLGSYSSRYSDFDGFWLFGFLVSDLALMEVDLLASVELGRDVGTPAKAARRWPSPSSSTSSRRLGSRSAA